MQRLLSLLVLALVLALATPAQADEASSAQKLPANRIEQLTGKVWQQSSQDAKLGVLFGVEMAIDVERAIADYMAKHPQKNKKRPPLTLSPFEKAWYETFKNVPLRDIVARIDAWYAANPAQSDRLVLDVVWREIMKKSVPND